MGTNMGPMMQIAVALGQIAAELRTANRIQALRLSSSGLELDHDDTTSRITRRKKTRANMLRRDILGALNLPGDDA
jgi:hypothetical protein